MNSIKLDKITEVILSFKNGSFSIIDVFMSLGMIEATEHLGLTYEDVCIVIDEWYKNGLLHYKDNAFRLTDKALEIYYNFVSNKGR